MIIIEAISSSSLVRNRGARKRAMFLQDDQRRVRPRIVEKEEEKSSARSKTLFGLFGFATQGDRGEKRSLAHSSRGTNSRGGRGAGSKSLPRPKSGKGQTPSNGSAKSDISSWLAKRAFSNQSGQEQQAIIERQGKLLAIVDKPSIAKQKDMFWQLLKMYTAPDQLLPEIAACVWFKAKKTEKYLLSIGISFTRRSCAQELHCKTDLHPEDNW